MKTYNNLYSQLCSRENLISAFFKARQRKTLKDYVIKFESELEWNLTKLEYELKTFTYSPRALTTFTIRDPKTRKISASSFRDRVVHHALCNIIEPILEKKFIYDSFANQKGKGTHSAIKRFEYFMKKVNHDEYGSKFVGGGGQRNLLMGKVHCGYALKGDIRHYFDTVDQRILLNIIEGRIKDKDALWLIKIILENHKTDTPDKGMPIGNLTSQFFANVYLNELDYFVKHMLKAKYYIRYVDDFVILHKDKEILMKMQDKIDGFLRSNLKVELHPEKTRIIRLENGITFLGFRIFQDHRLLKKSNVRRIWKRIRVLKEIYAKGKLTREEADLKIEGWFAYARFANTFKLRRKVLKKYNSTFSS